MGVAAQKRSKLTLFSDPADHYSHRIRMVLAEKAISFDLVDVLQESASQELAELNPYLSLPTLVDRELMLYEPLVMAEFLDERFPHPPMLPVYPVARAEIRQLIYRIENDWCRHVNVLISGASGNDTDLARSALTESFASVAPVFKEMDYFMSQELTLADCCIAPILWRLPLLNISLTEPAFKPMNQYMRRVFSRKGFVASLSEHERKYRSALGT